MPDIRVAIVGFGAIANNQHVPSINETPGVSLVATVDPMVSGGDIPHFASLDDLLKNGPDVDAVALCTPPRVRFEQTMAALKAGKHVLIEKPPSAVLSELEPIRVAADKAGRSLFAAWHSRFAPAVEPARAFLAKHKIKSVEIDWKENVRSYHAGQQWIWEPGGFGVFDPGINALSIVTRIMPRPFFLTKADLSYPENCQTPIVANLEFIDATGVPISAAFDWTGNTEQLREVRIDTDGGHLALEMSGGRLVHDGKVLLDERRFEYQGIYRRFVELVKNNASDFDLSPLVHVADSFMLGGRKIVEPFKE